MDNLISIICVYGLWVLLFLLIYFAFIIWIIKKGVKNAIVEVIDEDSLYDNIKYSVAEGVLLALEQYNDGNQEERPTE